MSRRDKPEEGGVRKVRMLIVVLLLSVFSLACLGKICYLSFFERGISSGTSAECIDTTVPGWDEESDTLTNCNCYVRENSLRPSRGEIYDDHGRLLMGNYTVFEVAFDGERFAKEYYDRKCYTYEESDIILHKLAKDFYQRFKGRFPKFSEDDYYQIFKKTSKSRGYRTIFPVKADEKNWITSLDTTYLMHKSYLTKKVINKKTGAVKKVPFYKYLNFVSTPVRVNPYGEMARRTLGVNVDGRHFGLEYTMDDILSGKDGSKKYLELNKAVVPLNDRIDPVDGYNIHSTINLEIQNAVHNELFQKLVELKADWGCVIVMETKTGEIKAISNLRRDSKEEDYYSESMEYALNAKVEPGSTFKLASLLAFFEKKSNDTACIYPMFNHTFEYPAGNGRIKRYSKSDSKVHGETLGTPNEIFQRSSNIGIASMIFDAYGMKNFKGYRAQLEKFGIFDTIHTQLGDIYPANIKKNVTDFNTFYATCFGAGFNIPVLHTLIYYNAIANNGKMVAPLFVKYISNEFDTITTFETQVLMEHMVSNRTLLKARSYLDSVVWGKYGTGRHYKDPTCPFAGKTGTRDIWDAETGAYNYDRNAVSFCGYFPKDNPKYTAIIYLYNVPQHSEVAVDVFAKIARSIMNSNNFSAMHNVKEYPIQKITQTPPINKRYFNTLFGNYGHDTVTCNSPYRFFSAASADSSRSLNIKVMPVRKLEGAPDVRNMIASDAIAELTRYGYKVAITGRGKVTKQIIDNNRKFVHLYLEPPGH